MPTECSGIADHAELSGDVVRACAYVEWLRVGAPLRLGDFPALGAAVAAVLAALPAEVAALVVSHVFLGGPAQPPGVCI